MKQKIWPKIRPPPAWAGRHLPDAQVGDDVGAGTPQDGPGERRRQIRRLLGQRLEVLLREKQEKVQTHKPGFFLKGGGGGPAWPPTQTGQMGCWALGARL